MAPALRMTRSIKEKQPIFFLSRFDFEAYRCGSISCFVIGPTLFGNVSHVSGSNGRVSNDVVDESTFFWFSDLQYRAMHTCSHYFPTEFLEYIIFSYRL